MPIDLIVDSTGLSIVGEGEWAAAKHGKRGKRGWKKLHIGVDGDSITVAQILIYGNADDAKTGLGLMKAVVREIASVTADAAYDTVAIYDAAHTRGAKVVIPPTRKAKVTQRGPRSGERDRTIEKVENLGRRQWLKESGNHRQGRAENTMFRYKGIVGDRLRARHAKAQETEVAIACNTLNCIMAFGRPESCAIAS